MLIEDEVETSLDIYHQPPRAESEWEAWTKHFEATLK
jgi:hypothetical protein